MDPKWQLCLRGRRTCRRHRVKCGKGENRATLLSWRPACLLWLPPLVDVLISVIESRTIPFNAAERIMGYHFAGFRDAHGCKQSLCGNNEYGTWPQFVNLHWDSQGIQPHFCNKFLPVWLIMVLLKDPVAPRLELRREWKYNQFLRWWFCHWYHLINQVLWHCSSAEKFFLVHYVDHQVCRQQKPGRSITG